MISHNEPLLNLLPFQFVALPKCVVQYTLLQPLFLMIATLFTIDVREKDMFVSLSLPLFIGNDYLKCIHHILYSYFL